jgi:polyribonucleotide nucleotidyltransferase
MESKKSMERVELALGGHTLSIETGRMAKQADGAVVVRLGDTMVLATACAQHEPRVGVDFLPLTVDYREGNYASGKIPGGFFKREGRPHEKETCSRRTSRTTRTPCRSSAPRRRSTSRTSPSSGRSLRYESGTGTAPSSSTRR